MSQAAVVMCIWQRPELLAGSLQMLARQTWQEYDLYLINNNPDEREYVDLMASLYREASVTHNPTNHGSFAKIEEGHRLACEGYAWIILIDDDFTMQPRFLERLYGERREDAIVSWWVHTLLPGGDYWARIPTAPGETGHYAEGKGTICPAGALSDPGILDVDRRFSPADNLWMSFHANHYHGYKMVQASAETTALGEVIVDGKDQYIHHVQLKRDLLAELRGRGWGV